MSSSSPIAASFAGPELLQRDSTQTIRCALFRDGAAVAGIETVSIYRASRAAVVSAAAVTVSSGWPYSAGPFTLILEEGWRVEWVLTGSGYSQTFDRMAALCRRRLFPVITDSDLTARHSDLANIRPPSMTTFQSYIDVAWEDLLHQLRQKGTIPHLVASAEDLKQVHTFLTLKLVFTDFAIRFGDGSRWPELAAMYAKEARAAFSQLSLHYSTDDSGTPDGGRRPAQPMTSLAAAGSWWL
jgi:hypothetical protein